ncbi:hypothetical protein K9M79_07595 [Candidatus Woesearchaeota archaeon]|nr:hypothetical protein [Candidatus Woesearchaeota archaeon]
MLMQRSSHFLLIIVILSMLFLPISYAQANTIQQHVTIESKLSESGILSKLIPTKSEVKSQRSSVETFVESTTMYDGSTPVTTKWRKDSDDDCTTTCGSYGGVDMHILAGVNKGGKCNVCNVNDQPNDNEGNPNEGGCQLHGGVEWCCAYDTGTGGCLPGDYSDTYPALSIDRCKCVSDVDFDDDGTYWNGTQWLDKDDLTADAPLGGAGVEGNPCTDDWDGCKDDESCTDPLSPTVTATVCVNPEANESGTGCVAPAEPDADKTETLSSDTSGTVETKSLSWNITTYCMTEGFYWYNATFTEGTATKDTGNRYSHAVEWDTNELYCTQGCTGHEVVWVPYLINETEFRPGWDVGDNDTIVDVQGDYCCGDDELNDDPDYFNVTCCEGSAPDGVGDLVTAKRLWDDFAAGCRLNQSCWNDTWNGTNPWEPQAIHVTPCCGDDEEDNPDMGEECCTEGYLGNSSDAGGSSNKQVWSYEFNNDSWFFAVWMASGNSSNYTGPCCGDDNETDDPDWTSTTCELCILGNNSDNPARLWDSDAKRCCGDDTNITAYDFDDPDQFNITCCQEGPVGDSSGNGSDNRQVYDPNATIDTYNGGACCGDDNETDDPDMGNISCLYCVLGNHPGTGPDPEDPSKRKFHEAGRCCGDDLEDCMDLTTSATRCVGYMGAIEQTDCCPPGDFGCWGGPLPECGGVTDLPTPGPYNTTEGSTYWMWANPSTMQGEIITVTCANYDIVSDASKWISCTDPGNLLFGDEESFNLDCGGGSVSNPYFISTTDYLCYTNGTGSRPVYQISECCGTSESNCQSRDPFGERVLLEDAAPVYRNITYDEETYYCANDNDWTTDLDVKEQINCETYGFSWSGTYCCGEDDDKYEPNNYQGTLMGEWYTDSGNGGICWNNTYETNGNFLKHYDEDGALEHEFTEAYIYNGSMYGCAIDEVSAESGLTPDWDPDGFATDGNKNKPYNGSVGDISLDFLNYSISASHKGNDFLLYMYNCPNPGENGCGLSSNLIIDMAYCSTVNDYYCSYEEVWKPIDGAERSHLSYIPFNGTADTIYAECCGTTQCWDGSQCVDSQHDDPNSDGFNGTDYRCIRGDWIELGKKYSPDRSMGGYCEIDSQCLINPNGDASANGNTTLFYTYFDYDTMMFDSSNLLPQCLNDTQWVYDYYCHNGTWTSRTSLLATELANYGYTQSGSNFTLFCDNYGNALNYYDYDIDYQQAEDFFGKYCGSDFGRSVNCTNMICVLQHDNGVAFGTSLNQPVNSLDYGIMEMLGFSNDLCAGVMGTQTDSFQSCGSGVFYSVGLNTIIFDDSGFAGSGGDLWDLFAGTIGSWIDNVLSVIMSALHFESVEGFDLDDTFLSDTSLFQRLYLSKKAGNTIYGIWEGFYVEYPGYGFQLTEYISVMYDGFDASICDTANEMRAYSCAPYSGDYYVRIKRYGGGTEELFDYWPDLTAKLRVE